MDVREAILASRDQSAALTMMLKAADLFNINTFIRDVESVSSGAVAPQLLVARYPWALGGVAIAALAVLMLLWRAVVGRRPRRPVDSAGALAAPFCGRFPVSAGSACGAGTTLLASPDRFC